MSAPGKIAQVKAKAGHGSSLDRIRTYSESAGFQRGVVAAVVLGALIIILSMALLPRKVDVEVGQPSKVDIEAPRDVVNRPRTTALQEEAGKQAVKKATSSPENYDISPAASINAEDTVDMIFGKAVAFRRLYAGSRGSENGITSGLIKPDEARKLASGLSDDIRRDTGVELPSSLLVPLLTVPLPDLEAARTGTKQAVGAVMREIRISRDDVPAARSAVEARLSAAGITPELMPVASAIAKSQIGPNLVLNPAKVERARQEAMQAVEPIMILKGQTIVRRGEIVTGEHVAILQDLGLLRSRVNYPGITGVVVLSLVFAGILGGYLYQYRRDIIIDPRLLALMGTLVILVAGLSAMISMIPWPRAPLLIPAAFGSMLVAMTLDGRLAIISSIIFGLLAGIMGGNALSVTVVSTITAITGAFAVTRVGERSDLVRAGLIVGAANAIAIAGVGPIAGDPEIIKSSYLGLVNGIGSTVLAIGLLPFLENLFHITTSIRLLELSNPNQPLLKRLLMEAPGTYHHSIIVGNLAEAAAADVGADTMLVRAGAYYHDIGKIKRPYLFVENQLMQDNPHDRISPSLSALVILSHVKDGVELARARRLPQAIVDIIMQHHGTGLVKYFYHKAQEANQDTVPDESDFRYPGPRPQSREAAIVMLADCVEAGVRSLSRPTPGRIEGFVRKMIKDQLTSGQLDECDLTFKDLDIVARAFVRVLTGIFHPRVEYPAVIAPKDKGIMSKEAQG
ncbi:MAG TPA: HDIG domain-containing protein [Firmicutes bacterium]|nr:HDIG domain-containing protein [Bacillota bacterium]